MTFLPSMLIHWLNDYSQLLFTSLFTATQILIFHICFHSQTLLILVHFENPIIPIIFYPIPHQNLTLILQSPSYTKSTLGVLNWYLLFPLSYFNIISYFLQFFFFFFWWSFYFNMNFLTIIWLQRWVGGDLRNVVLLPRVGALPFIFITTPFIDVVHFVSCYWFDRLIVSVKWHFCLWCWFID